MLAYTLYDLLGIPNDREHAEEGGYKMDNVQILFVGFSLMISLEMNVEAGIVSYWQLWACMWNLSL